MSSMLCYILWWATLQRQRFCLRNDSLCSYVIRSIHTTHKMLDWHMLMHKWNVSQMHIVRSLRRQQQKEEHRWKDRERHGVQWQRTWILMEHDKDNNIVTAIVNISIYAKWTLKRPKKNKKRCGQWIRIFWWNCELNCCWLDRLQPKYDSVVHGPNRHMNEINDDEGSRDRELWTFVSFRSSQHTAYTEQKLFRARTRPETTLISNKFVFWI